MSRVPFLLVLGGLWLSGLCTPTCAVARDPTQEVAVIVHLEQGPDIAKREEIAQIFLARRKLDPSGRPLVPVNLPPSDPTRQVFSERILGAPPEAWEAYWTERYFQGVTPPAVVASPEAMLRFVAATPGAVGYLPACRADARVRVLFTIQASSALAPRVAAACGH